MAPAACGLAVVAEPRVIAGSLFTQRQAKTLEAFLCWVSCDGIIPGEVARQWLDLTEGQAERYRKAWEIVQAVEEEVEESEGRNCETYEA